MAGSCDQDCLCRPCRCWAVAGRLDWKIALVIGAPLRDLSVFLFMGTSMWESPRPTFRATAARLAAPLESWIFPEAGKVRLAICGCGSSGAGLLGRGGFW